MGLPKYAKKRDVNEPEIVHALEAIGCKVVRLDQPVDLLVGFQARNYLLEVKQPGKENRKDQQHQRDWMRQWPGQVRVVRTPEEALDVVLNCYVDSGAEGE